jgi:hypothetical protein
VLVFAGAVAAPVRAQTAGASGGAGALAGVNASAVAGAAPDASNLFDDPFLPVTAGLPGCPEPAPPAFTPEQVRAEAHVRAQHGGSCYRVGRCRLPNSYLYDKEIIPRVQKYIREDGRFNDTTLWILGERRLVTIMGCVRTREQALELERTVQLVDDVMGVIPQVIVGTQGRVMYRLARP